MDKKIVMIMVSLLVIAAVVVAFVMIAAGGGLRSSGGFTKVFDKLDAGIAPDENRLQLPNSWDTGDVKKASDTIVDLTYDKTTIQQTTVYLTHLWFVYSGEKWADAYEGHGTNFYVPVAWGSGWLHVEHGMFSLTVSSATNLSAKYSNGDVITLESEISFYGFTGIKSFGEWKFAEPF